MSYPWKTSVGFVVVSVLVSIVGLGAAQGCRRAVESAGGLGSVAPVEADWSVRNEEQLLALVSEVSGLPQDLLQESAIKLVTLEEDNTPFLSGQIIGRPLWQVTTPKWKLQLPSAVPRHEDRYERIFEILVDPVSGSIVKIATVWPQHVPGEPAEVPVASAEAQMRNNERYHGFPDIYPGGHLSRRG